MSQRRPTGCPLAGDGHSKSSSVTCWNIAQRLKGNEKIYMY